jgi:hypothetical protein
MNDRWGWSPFDDKGRVRIVTNTSPWWKRLWAKVTRKLIWFHLGAGTWATISDEHPPRIEHDKRQP